MPRGTCDICGCTEERACAIEDGCAWANPEQTLCSACVGWAMLKPGNRYRGVFDYDLVPVLDLMPLFIFCKPVQKRVMVVRIDVRRLDHETHERLSFIAAQESGLTVLDYLDCVASGQEMIVLGASMIEGTIAARSRERALSLIPDVRAGRMPTLERCFGQEVTRG